MGLGPGDHVVEGNAIEGGRTGITITSGEAQLLDNVVQGVSNRGIAIARPGRPVLSGNRSCGNGENLWIADGAQPQIDDTNEICEDDATE